MNSSLKKTTTVFSFVPKPSRTFTTEAIGYRTVHLTTASGPMNL
ncbi:hypothetical protein MCHI_001023 [Candidatus Magnetoovum chiemensis]|nr:hypothetical protein MCHI_001023 [Candidatus Magnetoovum chiemensis]